jgi:hypothetical protein
MIPRKYSSPAKVFLAILLALSWSGLGAQADDGLALRIGRLHKGNGDILQNALVIIKQGKIEYVGADRPVPQGVRVLEYKNGVATPGFIRAVGSHTRAQRPLFHRSQC